MRHSPPTAAALAVTAALLLAPPAVRAADAANLVLNGGAEQGKNDQPSIWGAASVPAAELKMTRDLETFHAGKASLFISNAHQYDRPTANNWAQSLQSMPVGKTVVLSGWVKSLDADAANICLQCWDATGDTMLGFASTPVVRGDQDWTELKSDPLVVPAATKSMMVRAALSGLGKAWFDDVAVTQIEGAAEADTGGAPPAGATAAQPAAAGPVSPATLDKALVAAVTGEIAEALPVDRDQMVLSYMPEWAFGRVDNIAIANNQGGVRTLFAWPKPSAPAAGHRFLLACYARKATAPADQTPSKIGAYELLGDWDEQTPWTKQPKTADAPTAEFDFAGTQGWVTFDVTAIVRKQLAGNGAPKGVMLRFQREDADAKTWSGYEFVSREGEGEWAAKHPVLLVVKD